MKRYLDRRLKLHQLRIVDAISTHKSLIKAAAAVGLTQPALSKALHEIETMMGARLFDRHGRGVAPNAFGALVTETARRILLDVRRLDIELDRLAERVEGAVAVGALPTAAAGLLPGVVARLRATHPRVRVRIIEGRTEEMLSALGLGEIDLVVGRLYDPPAPDAFLRTVLYQEPIALLARADHPLFAAARIDAALLAALPLALPTLSQRVSQEIDQFLRAVGLSPGDQLRTSSLPLIREMLLATDTITAMPRLMMAGDVLRGTIRPVPILVEAAPRPAGLIQRSGGELSAGAQAFVETMRDYIADLDAGITREPDAEADEHADTSKVS